jgi:hypothetical protein
MFDLVCPQLEPCNLNLSLSLNLSNAVFVLRRYDCLAEGNGISRASLCDNGNAFEKRGLRLDITSQAFSVIRAWQYRGRFWPQTHQGQAQFLLRVSWFIGRNKKSYHLRSRVGYFSQADLDTLLGLTDTIWKELNKLISSFTAQS